MVDFPDIVEIQHTIHSGDLCAVGEFLGYQHNDVVEQIRREGFYSEDGEGHILVTREDDKDEYTSSEMLNTILMAIFTNYPDMHQLLILDQ